MAEQPEACAAWQDDIAGWVVAQISPEREAALLAHLEGCDVCRAEADSLLAVAAVSLAVDPLAGRGPDLDDRGTPPADLGDRVVAKVAAERRARRLTAAVAAVAGVAAAAVLAVVLLRPDDAPAPLEGDPVAFTVVPEGATASAVVAAGDRGGSLVELVATGLDPATTYALWLSPAGGGWEDRVAAGTFRPDADGDVEVRLPCSLPADETGRVWATTPEDGLVLDTA